MSEKIEKRLEKSIKLTGEALWAARLYDETLKTCLQEYEQVRQQAMMQLQKLEQRHLLELEDAWMKMANLFFDSEEEARKSWQNPNYRLDFTYMKDHGDAYFNIFEKEDKAHDPEPDVYGTGGTLH